MVDLDHGGQATAAPAGAKPQAGGNSHSPLRPFGSPVWGIRGRRSRGTLAAFVSSTSTASRLFAPRPRSGILFDTAIAAVALAGSLAQLSHGGVAGSQAQTAELDWIGGALVACSTLPLIAWRRAPLGVFALTASVTVLLGGVGYPIAVPIGPTAGLYLLAASRDEQEPWTRRNTGLVVALFAAYLGASALGKGGFPGGVLLHTGLAWAVAWFAGERTRLRTGARKPRCQDT